MVVVCEKLIVVIIVFGRQWRVYIVRTFGEVFFMNKELYELRRASNVNKRNSLTLHLILSQQWDHQRFGNDELLFRNFAR